MIQDGVVGTYKSIKEKHIEIFYFYLQNHSRTI
jgi:hypothetical protein